MDTAIGAPFNIAGYALLNCMIAQAANMVPGELVHSTGDAHIYLNHVDAVKEQLTREPFPAPTLWLNPTVRDLFSFQFDDIKLVNYQHHEAIRLPIAV